MNVLSRWTADVIVAYLIVTGGLVLWHRGALERPETLIALHGILVAAIWTLRRLPPRQGSGTQFLQDWCPVFLFPVLYKEVELLARAFGNWGLTARLQSLEMWLFSGHPSEYLSERFSWVPLSEYLHFCYLFYVILVPLVGGIWYFTGKRDAFHELVLAVSVTFSTSYLFYVLFPVDSPFYLSDPPGAPLLGHFFYELVHIVSSHGGARGGAFPSSHVSISTVVLLMTMKHGPQWLWWLAPIYVGLVTATVYGRFHYAVDVVAGWALAAVVVIGTRRFLDDSAA